MQQLTEVKHVNRFWAIYEDFKRIGRRTLGKSKRADLFASGMRVLELARNEQIKRLRAQGLRDEEISEEMLGFALTWEQFVAWSDGHYSMRSYEKILPQIEAAGFVKHYYVEYHVRRREDGREELIPVCNEETGQPHLYQSFDEARRNRRDRGEVTNFFFFDCGAVNQSIEEIYGPSSTPTPPGPPPAPTGGERDAKNGDAGREALAHANAEQSPSSSSSTTRGENSNAVHLLARTIAQGSHFCEPTPPQTGDKNTRKNAGFGQGSQKCEPTGRKSAREGSQKCEGKARKSARNKNSKKDSEESFLKEESISAPRAIDPLHLSQFDFSQPPSQEAIGQLIAILYPTVKAPSEREKQAAQNLSTSDMVATLGLRRLAALMAYHVEEASPCEYRAFCRAGGYTGVPNPGVQMRPYQLESELVLRKMDQEMEACGWWPEYLPRATGLVETPPEIDLAELAGIDRDARIGMDTETARHVEAWLAEQLAPCGDYEVRHRRVGACAARGYAIEVHYTHKESATRRLLRFYSPEEWNLAARIMNEQGLVLGSFEFVEALEEAYRYGDVA